MGANVTSIHTRVCLQFRTAGPRSGGSSSAQVLEDPYFPMLGKFCTKSGAAAWGRQSGAGLVLLGGHDAGGRNLPGSIQMYSTAEGLQNSLSSLLPSMAAWFIDQSGIKQEKKAVKITWKAVPENEEFCREFKHLKALIWD